MKQHPTIPHICITEEGKVFSKKTNKFLTPHKNKKGYLVLTTRFNGRSSPCVLLRVHRLVAETYVTNPDEKPFVNHKDGDKSNNHYSNLDWVTAKENVVHAYANGLSKGLQKYDNPQCKVSPETVEKAKQMRRDGYTYRAIAKELSTVHSRVLSWVAW